EGAVPVGADLRRGHDAHEGGDFASLLGALRARDDDLDLHQLLEVEGLEAGGGGAARRRKGGGRGRRAPTRRWRRPAATASSSSFMPRDLPLCARSGEIPEL